MSNFVSGIILLTEKSIKPGDLISVGDSFGSISSLNARYVSVAMFDGREVLIPNEDLITQPVQNWSFADSYIRIEITFGVSYDSDPHRVREIAIAAAEKHPRVVRNNTKYPILCHVSNFGDSSVDFFLRFFISDPETAFPACAARCFSICGMPSRRRRVDSVPAARGTDQEPARTGGADKERLTWSGICRAHRFGRYISGGCHECRSGHLSQS